VGRLQPAVQAFIDSGIVGPVLDIGCGTGQTSRALARQGLPVTGIDLAPHAINAAKQLIQQHGLESLVGLPVGDATKLDAWPRCEQFNTIIDAALLYVFPSAIRGKHVADLAHVAAPAAQLCVICFRDQEPGNHGPLRISRPELLQDFGLPATSNALNLRNEPNTLNATSITNATPRSSHHAPRSPWPFKSLNAVGYLLRPDATPQFNPDGADAWQLILTKRRAPQS